MKQCLQKYKPLYKWKGYNWQLCGNFTLSLTSYNLYDSENKYKKRYGRVLFLCVFYSSHYLPLTTETGFCVSFQSFFVIQLQRDTFSFTLHKRCLVYSVSWIFLFHLYWGICHNIENLIAVYYFTVLKFHSLINPQCHYLTFFVAIAMLQLNTLHMSLHKCINI